MKQAITLLALLFFTLLGVSAGQAQIVIVPTFESSITSNPNAAIIEAGINADISRLESYIETPITVHIDYTTMSSGLGENESYYGYVPYDVYRSQLASTATSTNDVITLNSLPIQTNNPVNGDPYVAILLPAARMLGFSGADPPPGDPDGTVMINLSELNLSRTGPQNPSLYDLQAVVAHEMDEVLGVGGFGSTLNYAVDSNGGSTSGIFVGNTDLFRYSAPGVRSFSTSPSATAYFSIDGGVTDITNFNQNSGGDFGDYATGATPQVQDAYGWPGVDINLGKSELTALDVVGYTLTPAGLAIEGATLVAPEPRTNFLLLSGLIALLGFSYRRKKA